MNNYNKTWVGAWLVSYPSSSPRVVIKTNLYYVLQAPVLGSLLGTISFNANDNSMRQAFLSPHPR